MRQAAQQRTLAMTTPKAINPLLCFHAAENSTRTVNLTNTDNTVTNARETHSQPMNKLPRIERFTCASRQPWFTCSTDLNPFSPYPNLLFLHLSGNSLQPFLEPLLSIFGLSQHTVTKNPFNPLFVTNTQPRYFPTAPLSPSLPLSSQNVLLLTLSPSCKTHRNTWTCSCSYALEPTVIGGAVTSTTDIETARATCPTNHPQPDTLGWAAWNMYTQLLWAKLASGHISQSIETPTQNQPSPNAVH